MILMKCKYERGHEGCGMLMPGQDGFFSFRKCIHPDLDEKSKKCPWRMCRSDSSAGHGHGGVLIGHGGR
ncbi:hypothetical protein LCGC14_1400440 [marine sediment metagenome]|uniref:Uncharacterized protein n=1 Tax=marine sediment metagenome TaxID=412755 RepID=A0A0F9JX94_9ZZZZ